MKTLFSENQSVICVDNNKLKGNEVAPPLEVGKQYKINKIVLDREGNQHLDVGLKSKYNYIRSFETKEELIDGEKIHWCHPSRFKLL